MNGCADASEITTKKITLFDVEIITLMQAIQINFGMEKQCLKITFEGFCNVIS